MSKTIKAKELKKGDSIIYQDNTFIIDDVIIDRHHMVSILFNDGQRLTLEKSDEVEVI